jgi:uncharacterized membrane protein YdjX (TVP38/TMEM64 family)
MSGKLSKNIAELSSAVINYLQVKVDLTKLSVLEKTSKFATYFFNLLVVILLSVIILAFGAAAFTVWFGQTYDNYFGGTLIATGSLIVVALIFLLLRKRIIGNSVLRNFSEIMFEEEEKEA